MANIKHMSNNIFEGKEIQFPVIYDLKVVLDTKRTEDENKRNIEAALSQTGLSYQEFSTKVSSKGSYVSYSVSLLVPTKDKFEELYNRVHLLPGIKYAL